METELTTVTDWFNNISAKDKRSRLFGAALIPERYQRTYAWESTMCNALIHSVESLIQDDDKTHFLGSVLVSSSLVIEDFCYTEIADGQQRITSLSLMIKAGYDQYLLNTMNSNQDQKTIDSVTAKFKRFLWTVATPGRGASEAEYNYDRPLLKVSSVNQIEFNNLLKNEIIDISKLDNGLMNTAYKIFRAKFKNYSIENLATISDVISQLEINVISADASSLQEIFETANSLGVSLSISEMIKNFITMGVDEECGNRLFKTYLEPLDIKYNSSTSGKETLSNYYSRYLISIIGPNESLTKNLGLSFSQSSPPFKSTDANNVYRVFKAYLKHEEELLGSREKAYENFLKGFLTLVTLIESLDKISTSEIRINSFNDKNSTIAAILDNPFIKGHIDANTIYHYLRLFKLLFPKKPIPRQNILFWFLIHSDIFMSVKANRDFVEKTVRIVISYLLRCQLLMNSGFSGEKEIKLLIALENSLLTAKSYSPSEGGLNKEAQKSFLINLISKINNFIFMESEKDTELEVAILNKMSYGSDGGNAYLKFLFTEIEDGFRHNSSSSLMETQVYWNTVKDFSIEHIYPQHPASPQAWKGMSKELPEAREELTHNLGNLTILTTSDNRNIGNFSLLYKLNYMKSKKFSPLNECIYDLSGWNSNANSLESIKDIKYDSSNDLVVWNPKIIIARAQILKKLVLEQIPNIDYLSKLIL